MDTLIEIGGGLIAVALALVAFALSLFVLGAVSYLLYIPIRFGWWGMRQLLAKIGIYEAHAIEHTADTVTKIDRDINELNEKLGILIGELKR